MTYRILVTGSRDWPYPNIVENELISAVNEAQKNGRVGLAEDVIVVHGDCPTGADAQADAIAIRYGFTLDRHPANWGLLGKAAGPTRNKEMVDLGADLCLAFLGPKSRGGKGCAKFADEAGIETKRIKMDYV